MQSPQNHADVLELSRQVDGLFAAAFAVSQEFGPAELKYIADVFDPAQRDQVPTAARAIAEACRRVANTGAPFFQPIGLAPYPTLVVAGVPFVVGGRATAVFGVIFHCADEGECLRRMARLTALADQA